MGILWGKSEKCHITACGDGFRIVGLDPGIHMSAVGRIDLRHLHACILSGCEHLELHFGMARQDSNQFGTGIAGCSDHSDTYHDRLLGLLETSEEKPFSPMARGFQKTVP